MCTPVSVQIQMLNEPLVHNKVKGTSPAIRVCAFETLITWFGRRCLKQMAWTSVDLCDRCVRTLKSDTLQ